MTQTPADDTPTPDQLALMTPLLEDLDADVWVVCPVGALLRQLNLALGETSTHDGRVRPGRLGMRLVRNLHQIGWSRSTLHPQPSRTQENPQ